MLHTKRHTQHARLLLFCLVCTAWAGCSGGNNTTTQPEPTFPPPDTLSVSIPGFPPMQVPEDNPLTQQGVDLGRRLFYDTRLSGDNSQSCATCHDQAFAFSDRGRRFSEGIDGSLGSRNAPALINVGFNLSNFWDGRVETLEEQALEPVVNPIEMNDTWENVVAELAADPEYPDLFGKAFGSRDITPQRVVQAIAQFERTLISANSRYDRWRRGEVNILPSEQRGFLLFFTERADCFHCHDEFKLTTRSFHNIGLEANPVDPGLGGVTQLGTDLGKFKAPTLRNIALTAPYMHDGRFATLEDVIDHYDSGGVSSPNVDPFIRVGRGLGLTEIEKQDIKAFLEMLTDSTFINNPDFADPFVSER